jgi:uncharacterized protein (DUF924 family)
MVDEIGIQKKERDFSKLLELFNFWYGLKFYPTNQTKKENLLISNLPIQHIREIWENIWFAKNEKQIIIDSELEKFKGLIEDFQNYETSEFYEKMAIIILYDQITRNIFRRTSKAYDYDHISRGIALHLLEKIESLPFQFQLTVLICLCHSENMEHQSKVREYVKNLNDKVIYSEYKEIVNTLLKISDNHYIRVFNFGRIPERNPFVGRVDTSEETIFLNNLK